MPLPRPLSRRRFLESAALATVAGLSFPHVVRSAVSNQASKRLNLAFIGVGGKGQDPVFGLRQHNYLGFCDVDDERAAPSYREFPSVPRFRDFRRLLDRHGHELDAVIVCTPDHTHFHPVIAAMQRKLHVFVEKPMASTIWETRLMHAAAKKYGIVTQMGIQGHLFSGLKLLREWLQAGALGQIKEVFLWTDRPLSRDIHDFTGDAPDEPVPTGVDWDLWLGPARERPFSRHYLPQHWRAWWDFGQSALGDIGAHMFDVVEFALQVGFPSRVTGAASQRRISFATPRWSNCCYEYDAVAGRAALKLHWFSGMKEGLPNRPSSIPFLPADTRLSDTGMAFVGTEGCIYVPDMRVGSRPEIFPEIRWMDFKKHLPKADLSQARGDIFTDWIDAIREGSSAQAGFDYSAPLCEATFLGNLAMRTGKDIIWDRTQMKALDVPEADAFVRPPFVRKGWDYSI